MAIAPSELSVDHLSHHQQEQHLDHDGGSMIGSPDVGQFSSEHDRQDSFESTLNSNDNRPSNTLLSNSDEDPHVVSVEGDAGGGETKLDTSQLPPDSLFQQRQQRTVYKEYLTNDAAEKACKFDRGYQRMDRLNNTYLNYCTRYKLENLFSNEVLDAIMHRSSEKCEQILDEFIRLDELIDQFYVLFKNLLTRYNCHNGYSVKWSCEDCKKAYKDWLCATSLPCYMKGEHVKPCISFCERVEQRCPYLHPITKEQYGGQPVFICRDPNIPFVTNITPDIPYNEPDMCYDLCHLSQNRTELVNDSLSKYPDKCPEKDHLAEQVRNDTSAGAAANVNGTGLAKHNKPSSDVHVKKLNELKEVLTVYKSQPKTHKYGHHSAHS